MKLMLPCRMKCVFVVMIINYTCINLVRAENVDSFNLKYIIKVKLDGKPSLLRYFSKLNLTKLYQITPSTYIFKYRGSQKTPDIVSSVFKKERYYKGTVVAIEPVRVYNDTLRPVYSTTDELSKRQTSPLLSSSNLVCDDYYGMGVPVAWLQGYTGQGVKIAVTDVGVNTYLEDLKDNIDSKLSYNFVDESRDVTPEFFHNIQDKASSFTDHGNKVTSIIAATKGNNLCSAGIAYNATIIALKIYTVKLVRNILQLEPSHWTNSETISRALVYEVNTIDIYANAWAPTRPFDALDMATREAIKYGAKHGRHGLGNIYVIPSGPTGNELSNNIYTITVNSIGRNGTVPEYTNIDASVITCGLGDGNNLTASFMVTTTLNNACVTDFFGVSAATSQIAAIIALAIQVNSNLSLRDIQHLLVHASDKKGLQDEKAFRKNAVGKYFHDVFGFGLIDAEKLVNLSVKQQPVSRLLQKNFTTFNRHQKEQSELYTFCYSCNNPKKENCLTTIEHVVVTMNPTVNTDDIKIELQSPGGTVSLLIDYTSKKKFSDVYSMKLVSVHFWGELPFGNWSLIVRTRRTLDSTDLKSLSLTLTGTNNASITHDRDTNSYVCDFEKTTVSDVDNTLKNPTTEPSKENGSDRYYRYIATFTALFLPLILVYVVKPGIFRCLSNLFIRHDINTD